MTPLEEIAPIADVCIEIEIELDRKPIKLSHVLDLKVGSVIEFGRAAGENVDILAGKKLLASGEIVVVETKMGVRIMEFAPQN